MLKVVKEELEPSKHTPAAVGGSLLDDLVRDRARQMLAAALRAEVAAYIDAQREVVDEQGRRLVVRNGYHASGRWARRPARCRSVSRGSTTSASTRSPANKGGSPRRSCRRGRKSPGVAEVLPLLYLHGLSSGDFVPALEQFLGSAAGLSAAAITRLITQWQDDAKAFGKRSLKDTDYRSWSR